MREKILRFLFGPVCPDCGYRLNGYTKHDMVHFPFMLLKAAREAAEKEARRA